MPDPNRFAACIEYSGQRYSGWQRQHHAPSVQARVEAAAGRVANETVEVVASGRTDAGVHATGQIVHFDIGSGRTALELTRGMNTYLPDDICVIWAVPVDDGFHARFGALARRYRYVVLNRPVRPACLHGRVAWHRPPLDIAGMQAAASLLLGEHDFSAFRAAGCQNRNPVKTVTGIDLGQQGDWIWLDISANGFLHHMVRNIMGVLLRIGEGIESPKWARHVLESRDRKQGGVTSPACGLYFVSASYDIKFKLPPIPPACRFW
ncbi:MAG: tRNA pseudouridine(38-40) synthase TruA [Gammaproteobacteria bacterium]|nr:tRNA pseudouridine(38-40) synthase TruA [Gammaproteobacteria bacterium]MYD75094.1 tRNA pseudouridine(38-40) synthase TruA [Gammaproteobacteria bacterium]MYJ52897.1 tRNA pseudouridine(38-40) synthase TruA [Gammaproteobacteria bacterium]